MEGHTIVRPQDIKWGPAPAILPPGAEAAVLSGDPGKEGFFVLRLKLPAGYRVAPHTHPVDEVVTVISGTFCMGMGETADPSKAQPLPAGSFFALPPGTAHYVFTTKRRLYKSAPTVPGDLPTSTRRTIRGRSRSEVEEHPLTDDTTTLRTGNGTKASTTRRANGAVTRVAATPTSETTLSGKTAAFSSTTRAQRYVIPDTLVLEGTN